MTTINTEHKIKVLLEVADWLATQEVTTEEAANQLREMAAVATTLLKGTPTLTPAYAVISTLGST